MPKPPIDITPPVDAIQWDITPDMLMAICARHWKILGPAIKELEARALGYIALTPARALWLINKGIDDVTKGGNR